MQSTSITWMGILFASLLVVAQAVISLVLKLGLGSKLLLSSFRAGIQLSLVGIFLHWVFKSQNPLILALVIASMILVGSQTSMSRVQLRYSGLWLDCFFSLGINSIFVLLYGVIFVLRPNDGYRPQEVIPLAGMLIGNSLSGITLSLDQFTSQLHHRREEVETWLSHGATRWEAIQDLIRDSVRTGMTPILSSMSVAGIVSLPGALTGQLLAGEDPSRAVKYQIIILFLLLCVTFLGSICAILFAFRRLINQNHQLIELRL